jgi:hypothetical protein
MFASRQTLILLFLTALLVRCVVLAAGPWHDPSRAMQPDSGRYLVLAENLIRYGTFGKRDEDGIVHRAILELREKNGTSPRVDSNGLRPETFRTPGYPALIAAVEAHVRAVLVVQCLLGALTAAALPLIAGAAGITGTAGTVAGILWAIHPALVLYDNALMSESLFNALIVSALLLAITARFLPGVMAAGLLIGFAGLVRPLGLLYLPLAIVLCRARSGASRLTVITLIASAVVPSLIWADRNRHVGEGFRVSTVADENLLFYTAAYSISEQRGEDWLESWPERVRELTTQLGSRLAPGEDVVAAGRRLAFAEIASRPTYVARVMAKSAVKLAVDHSIPETAQLLGTSYKGSGLFSRLVLHEPQPDAGRTGIAALAALGWVLVNAIVAAAAFVGFLYACRERQWALIACGVTAVLFAISTGSVGLERFRVPMMLPMVVLTAHTLERISGCLHGIASIRIASRARLPRYSVLLLVAVAAVLSGGVAGCSRPPSRAIASSAGADPEAAVSPPMLSTFEDLANTRFAPVTPDPYEPPHVVKIPIPKLEGGSAVWGATGRDQQGHIWFGVSASPSAHLLEYLPEHDQVVDRGDAVSELKRANLYRDGEGQVKIHSKIIQAADGNLYFTSADEEGENEDGSKLPTWGSHLWRVRRPDYRWEHLMAAPEGLIAVSGFGTRIYALGYFDHVLYEFDCETEKIRSVRVGSVGGHISRNFLSDDRGHVYVPRLKYTGAAELTVTLVEFDPMLKEVAETPLRHYLDETPPVYNHGIVSFERLSDHTLAFITHPGYLYRVTPHDDRPADVTELGWMHPKGEAYVASLFSPDGARYLAGVSNRDGRYEWLVRDLVTGKSVSVALDLPKQDGKPLQDLALYGSLTRDNLGNFYLGGTYAIEPVKGAPVLLQVQPGRSAPISGKGPDDLRSDERRQANR